jgi:hypothetical protein
MTVRRKFTAWLLTLVLAAAAGCKSKPGSNTSYHPQIDPGNFTTMVDNPYFPLVPGTTWKYLEKSGNRSDEVVVTVTRETRQVMGVKCVVVHDIVFKNGRVAEDTYDWYAQDKQGAVWYFGEDTKEISTSGKVNTAGSWEAGVNGLPGIIMPANPKPGKPYRQEYSPKNAEDMGQVIAVNETVVVPYGRFTECVKTKDWSLLESGSENKWYARGIGCVRAMDTEGDSEELVSVTHE